MKQSNLAGATANNTRYTMNFNVPSECKGTAGMRLQLLEIYAKMREFCPTASILPWYDDKDLSEITSPDKIPETITLLQKYFPGVRPLESGGMNYAKVNLSFPITVDRPTFEKDIDSWGSGRNMRFYQCPVQHANVKTACWLPYLPGTTDCKIVSAKMSLSYEKTMHEHVPIGLFWRALNGQRDVPAKLRIRAIHVECPSDKTASVKRFLRLCSRQKKYPGGARFRVMSEFWPYMTDKNKARYRYMADKHKYFLEKIERCETTKILSIDTRIPGTRVGLRQVILNIRDKRDNHRIFHSIDVHWQNPSMYVLTFRPDKKTLAYQFNNSLPTYVRYLYPQSDLSHVFTLEAMDQAEDETYHPDKQSFTTLEDIAMMEEIQNDADDDSMEYMADAPIRPPDFSDDDDDMPVHEITNPRLFDLSGQTDSVSTMASENLSVTFSEGTSIGHDNSDDDAISKSPSQLSEEQENNPENNFASNGKKSDDKDVANVRDNMRKIMTTMKDQQSAATVRASQAAEGL